MDSTPITPIVLPCKSNKKIKVQRCPIRTARSTTTNKRGQIENWQLTTLKTKKLHAILCCDLFCLQTIFYVRIPTNK